MSNDNGIEENNDFERGFIAAESGEDLSKKSLNEDEQGESDDLDTEVGGSGGDSLSEEDSASDQILPEEDESGEETDLTGTGNAETQVDMLAEGRDTLERYFNDDVGNSGGSTEYDPASQVSALVTPDEDIADDVADILRVNPDYKEILLEDSDLGKRLRSNLFEFGAEAAVPMLESIHQSREISARVDAVTLQYEQDERAAHFDAVGKVHPDYMELVSDPAKQEELGKFNAGIKNWAETLPYKEATKAFKVMESGNASEVSELLTKFKEAKSEPKADKIDRQAARNIAAIPSKRKPARNSAFIDKSFEAGFNAAAGKD